MGKHVKFSMRILTNFILFLKESYIRFDCLQTQKESFENIADYTEGFIILFEVFAEEIS